MEGLNEKEWIYLNKGAANLVLAYNGTVKEYKNHVLRLRIKDNGVSTEEIFEYITKTTLFGKLRQWIVNMKLIHINERFTSYWSVSSKEKSGILMPNVMSCNTPHKVEVNKYIKVWHDEKHTNEILEFKPKWLNFKKDERRFNCRNCLIAKIKNEKFIICPLWLLNGPLGVDNWCEEVQKRVPFDIIHKLKNVVGGIEGLKVLKTLKELQCDCINTYLENPNEELQFQMTLRDLSIFYNLNTGLITVLDLDLKPMTKLQLWIKTEQKLQLMYRDESIGVQCCI